MGWPWTRSTSWATCSATSRSADRRRDLVAKGRAELDEHGDEPRAIVAGGEELGLFAACRRARRADRENIRGELGVALASGRGGDPIGRIAGVPHEGVVRHVPDHERSRQVPSVDGRVAEDVIRAPVLDVGRRAELGKPLRQHPAQEPAGPRVLEEPGQVGHVRARPGQGLDVEASRAHRMQLTQRPRPLSRRTHLVHGEGRSQAVDRASRRISRRTSASRDEHLGSRGPDEPGEARLADVQRPAQRAGAGGPCAGEVAVRSVRRPSRSSGMDSE